MAHYDYTTEGTCSKLISFDMEDGKISNVKFLGGCDGNLKAISSLVEGKSAEEVEKTLSGIKCGRKSTSCGDQLAKAVHNALAQAANA